MKRNAPNCRPVDKITKPRLSTYIWVVVVLWTMIVAGLFVLELAHLRNKTEDLAIAKARAIFNKDQAFRFWASGHGGVYVPVTEHTPPNPYLANVAERDIETPSGRKLTLMNPAYMVRQLNEDFSELFGARGHSISLDPLRPQNHADVWERKALERFEDGAEEFYEFTKIDGKPHLRFMEPMVVEKTCIKCHIQQGYREGDIKGGVSVSVPMEGLLAVEGDSVAKEAMRFAALWILVLVGIFLWGGRLLRYDYERRQMEVVLRANEKKYRTLLENLPQRIFLKDKNSTYISCNSNYAGDLGIEPDEIIGKTDYDFFPKKLADKYKGDDKRIRASGTIEDLVESYVQDGEERYIHIIKVPVRDENGEKNVLGLFWDITDEKMAEEKVEKAYDELLEKSERLEKFHRLTVGRELEMIRLKEEVNDLLERLGEPDKYSPPEELQNIH